MKLGLGTVQFGLDYGISNRTGRTPAEDVADILEFAAGQKIQILDTAPAYGDSEAVLGQALGGRQEFRIVTKTPGNLFEKSAPGETENHIRSSLSLSLEKLRVKSAYGLLVHHGQDLISPMGDKIFSTLQSLQAEGLVKKIGASVYSPEELTPILDRFEIDLVQLPLNPLDQRFISSGLLKRLRQRGVEVHARSTFLQGLLLLPVDQVSPHFRPILDTLKQFHHALKVENIDAVSACLRFSLGLEEVDHLVCGVNSIAHLKELVAASSRPAKNFDFSPFALSDPNFLEPRYWPK